MKKCHFSISVPNCWQLISNTNVYSKMHIPQPCPRRAHRHPPTVTYSPNCWQCKSNANVYSRNAQSSTPREGHTDTFQLTHIPQLYKCIFWKMHIPQPRPPDRGVCPKIILRLQKNILITFCSGNIKYSIQLEFN